MEISKKIRNITKEEVLENYKLLKELDCKNIGKNSRIGLICLDYFFLHHRIKAKTKRHISFYEALKDKKIMSYIDEKIIKIKNLDVKSLTEEELLRNRYNTFQLYYGTINQFRPTEALKVYCTLKPKIGVLDFSAGWGGRCLAAMAYNIPYIGIDANQNLEKSYNNMINTIDPKSKVKMIYKPSELVDFSNYKYDLVFTSPPYFMIEKYEKMPIYESRDDFLEKFFRPVVLSAWNSLHSPGYMALNIPKEMYDSIKDLLPRFTKRIKLAIANRHPTDAVLGKDIGDINSKKRSEGIYVWKKGGMKTRKLKNK